jgi:N-acetylneuraminic acid mutarotase
MPAAVLIYDITSRRWSEGAPMPTARGAAAVVAAGGRIHVIGGNVTGPDAVHEHDRPGVTSDNSVGTHEVYDPRTNTWERSAPMPTSRNHHGGAAAGNRIHVVGGRIAGNFEMTTHEVYDVAGGQWSSAAPLPTGRSGIAVVERAGRIYVFGGERPGGTFDEAERFDTATGRWEVLAPMPTPRHGLGAAVLGDQIHVVSGGPNPGFSFGTANERLGPG